MPSVVVQTRYGKVEGVQEGPICVWRGIPYARAPVGPLRFREPLPPEPWDGVWDAREFRAICVQVPNALNPADNFEQSEDCLFLNIWSPAADDKRRPVMVWIHGGGYVFGSGQSPWYDGSSFAANGDVVVVTINYRLGPFGFLYLGEIGGEEYANSGNLALLDMVAALKWVQENIAAFGGDPHRVTLFGESAGSWSVGALMIMPKAKGLFHRAILQSGIPSNIQDKDSATRTARQILEILDVPPTELSRLHELPAAEILEASQKLPPRSGMSLRPVLDGINLTQTFWEAIEAGVAKDIPVIVGSNKDELLLWVARQARADSAPDPEKIIHNFERQWGPIHPEVARYYLEGKTGRELYEALAKIGTQRGFEAPKLKMASMQVKHAPVWVYRFDWESPRGGLKASHALEIPFVFHTIDTPTAVAMIGDAPERKQLAEQMHRAWIAFAHNGDPNTPEIPHWPQYNLEQRPTMLFDLPSRVENDPAREERQLWERIAI